MKCFLWLEKCFALRWLWTYKCIINVLWSTTGPSKCRSEQPSNHRRPISHWTSLWNSSAKHYNIALPHGGGLEHYYSPSPPRPPTPAWAGCLSIAGVPQRWISCSTNAVTPYQTLSRWKFLKSVYTKSYLRRTLHTCHVSYLSSVLGHTLQAAKKKIVLICKNLERRKLRVVRCNSYNSRLFHQERFTYYKNETFTRHFPSTQMSEVSRLHGVPSITLSFNLK